MPSDVYHLSIVEYLAMVKLMDDERREMERQARKRGKRGR
jgi:hypothetical protein